MSLSRATRPFAISPREIQPHTASITLVSFKDSSVQRPHAVAGPQSSFEPHPKQSCGTTIPQPGQTEPT